jgi:NAD(P)-dependent dehydrogenase (short-subunit alcohol dehydrogenase family)
MTRAAAPHLRRSSLTPAVVNTASTASFVGYAHPAYCASKGAVLQLTRAMAIDLAPEVRCNCFCPGSTDTRLYRDGSEPGMPAGAESAMARTSLIPRPGEPGEVAKVAAFLASKDALFVTGAAYVVDGGSLAWRGTR